MLIDGRLIPVIPPYASAAFTTATVTAASCTAKAAVTNLGSSQGALSATVVPVQFASAGFATIGSYGTRVSVAAGGVVVTTATFCAAPLFRPCDAQFGVSAGLTAT
ncbi:hypothetical protein, partial [Streptomyces sp. NPDC059071]|uniref:hypothetical protein n=1 Tax=Streptomyces sp. NPDC059071 TaxID=3346714 RepID=UPI00369E216E